MKKIGIFGGTFNPIHNGHISAAISVLKEFNLDKIIFLPNNIPPHKKEPEITSEHRYNMVKLGISHISEFAICDYEINKKERSYTIDTILYLKEKYKDAQLLLIIGSDEYYEFKKWKDYEKILKNVYLIVLNRNNDLIDKNLLKGNVYFSKAEMLPVSSTEIRQMLKYNYSPEHLVPYKVYEYIRKHNLYKK